MRTEMDILVLENHLLRCRVDGILYMDGPKKQFAKYLDIFGKIVNENLKELMDVKKVELFLLCCLAFPNFNKYPKSKAKSVEDPSSDPPTSPSLPTTLSANL